jgi:hypothetical protein
VIGRNDSFYDRGQGGISFETMEGKMDRRIIRRLVAAALGGFILLGATLLCSSPAAAQWVVKSEDGNSQIKFGFLVQPRAEWVSTENSDYWSQNMYLRRARILMGGKVNPKVDFFFETDSPNVGKRVTDVKTPRLKDWDTFRVQDFVVTYSVTPDIMVDAGMILTPGTYNHLQSAASLLPLDYGPYTFIENGPLAANVGRDTGAQGRGVLLNKMVEYRVGVFQGVREYRDAMPFRVAGRLALYPFKTAGKGLFYPGTTLGASKALSIGLMADMQGTDYNNFGGDVFCELPIGGTSSLTAQVDVALCEGKNAFAAALPKQKTFMVEAGYAALQKRLLGFVQVAVRDYDADTKADDQQFQGGLGWRFDGHKSNLKLAYTMITQSAPKTGVIEAWDKTMWTLQYQVMAF